MNGKKDIPILFNPDKPGLEKFWGRLEIDVMEIIWANGPMTVKRALYFLNKSRTYAYTTVMTVMNRLVKKAILDRKKEGHSFIYSPSLSKKEFIQLATQKVIAGLLTDFKEVATRNFSRLRKTSHEGKPD